MDTKNPIWIKSPIPYLYKNRDSGIYYARLRLNGKQTFKSLKTTGYTTAKIKLSEVVKTTTRANKRSRIDSGASLSFSALLERYGIANASRTDIRDSTKHYYKQCLDVIKKKWGNLEQPVVRISEDTCRTFAESLQLSGQRQNNILDVLRKTLELGRELGFLHDNPAQVLNKKPIRATLKTLPNKQEFQAVVSAIRQAEGAVSLGCADLVEFLAYSGCRISEARRVKWEDVKENHIVIHEGKTESARRLIPIIEPMRILLDDIKHNPRYVRSSKRRLKGYVVSVEEAPKAMERACSIVGIKKITHHDLRHLFATTCIEAGIDIPTVAGWLGHKDKGALAMKVYGHLRMEHSLEMAKKVKY